MAAQRQEMQLADEIRGPQENDSNQRNAGKQKRPGISCGKASPGVFGLAMQQCLRVSPTMPPSVISVLPRMTTSPVATLDATAKGSPSGACRQTRYHFDHLLWPATAARSASSSRNDRPAEEIGHNTIA